MDGIWSSAVVTSTPPPSTGQDTSQAGAQSPSHEDYQRLQERLDSLSQKMEQQRAASYQKIEQLTLESQVLRNTLEAEREARLRAAQPEPARTANTDESWASEGWASVFSSSLGSGEQTDGEGDDAQVDPETFKEHVAEVAREVVHENEYLKAQRQAEGLQAQQHLIQRFFSEEKELANDPHYLTLVRETWDGSMTLNPDLSMGDRYNIVVDFVKRRAQTEKALREQQAAQQQQQALTPFGPTTVAAPPAGSPYPAGGQYAQMGRPQQQQTRPYSHEDRLQDLAASIQERKQILQKRSGR